MGRTPPVRRPRGPRRAAPKKVRFTFFRAEGSIRKLAAQIYGGYREGTTYEKRARKYMVLQSNNPAGFENSPGVWVSNEGTILGQVNFPGEVPLEKLRKMLNVALNLVDDKGKIHDFMRVYPNAKYKYQVIETLVVPKNREREFKEATPQSERVRIVNKKSGSKQKK